MEARLTARVAGVPLLRVSGLVVLRPLSTHPPPVAPWLEEWVPGHDLARAAALLPSADRLR